MHYALILFSFVIAMPAFAGCPDADAAKKAYIQQKDKSQSLNLDGRDWEILRAKDITDDAGAPQLDRERERSDGKTVCKYKVGESGKLLIASN